MFYGGDIRPDERCESAVFGGWIGGFEVKRFQAAAIFRWSTAWGVRAACWYLTACHKTNRIQHTDKHRQKNSEVGHPDSQLRPYKACGLELHPSMLHKSARALFSLQAAVHTHTHARTHTHTHTHTHTEPHTGMDLYCRLMLPGCHPCGRVRGAAVPLRGCRTEQLGGSLQRVTAAAKP